MGRGRAKAKQTKVARELKYSSPTMDLDALQREIGSGTATADKEPDFEDDYVDRTPVTWTTTRTRTAGDARTDEARSARAPCRERRRDLCHAHHRLRPDGDRHVVPPRYRRRRLQRWSR